MTPEEKLFPAHAGVIPASATPTFLATAIPRPRGGDPYDNTVKTEPRDYSPPTRG